MTCIAGVVAKDGTVYIGGDSAAVGSKFDLLVRADQKVFTVMRDGITIAFGFTSSFRMGQVLRYKLQIPAIPPDNLEEWMASEFIDSVRAVLKDSGFASKDKEKESGGTFLVGLKGRLFAILDDYQIAETVDQINAVGCGWQIALGSLWTTRSMLEPESRIIIALEAAERFSSGVRGPFSIVKAKV